MDEEAGGSTVRAADPPTRRIAASVVGLGVTQMIGWGTSFSSMAVLGRAIGADLNIPREAVFAGVTIMLVVSGALSPVCGRRLDRDGPRNLMATGALLAAAALLCIALARGPMLFWIGWVLFGAYVPMGLTNVAVPAVVQIAGSSARRAVTGLTIIGGVTSALFMPIAASLDALFGWRMTLLVFATLHLLIALPIVLGILPHGRPERIAATESKDVPWKGVVPAHLHNRAFWLIVAWSCLEGTLVWGFNMQAIDVFRGAGLATEVAIAAWMFSGPCQALARMIEFAFAGRYPIIVTAVVSAVLAPIGFAVVFALGINPTTAAGLAICYGLGHGLYTIARNMLPLKLFGLETFGATMGRLALPQSLANAIAPILFAALISRAGASAALAVSAAVTVASLVVVLMLARTVRGVERA